MTACLSDRCPLTTLGSYPTPAHVQRLAQLVEAPVANVRAWFHNARATARRTRDAAMRAYEAANGLPPGSYAVAHHVPLSSAWDAVVEDRAKTRAKRRRVEARAPGTGDGGNATADTAKRDTFVAAHLLPVSRCGLVRCAAFTP